MTKAKTKEKAVMQDRSKNARKLEAEIALNSPSLREEMRAMIKEELAIMIKENQPHERHQYIIQQNFLGYDEREAIITYMDNNDLSHGELLGDQRINKNIRDSDVLFINPYALPRHTEEQRDFACLMQSVFCRLIGLAHVSQETTFKDLPRIASYPTEKMQLTEYREGQFYGAHKDCKLDTDPFRILSVTLLVHEACEGGEFKFRDFEVHGVYNDVMNKAGTAILFPSSYYHEVTKVTQGSRRSIVMWFNMADNE